MLDIDDVPTCLTIDASVEEWGSINGHVEGPLKFLNDASPELQGVLKNIFSEANLKFNIEPAEIININKSQVNPKKRNRCLNPLSTKSTLPLKRLIPDLTAVGVLMCQLERAYLTLKQAWMCQPHMPSTKKFTSKRNAKKISNQPLVGLCFF